MTTISRIAKTAALLIAAGSWLELAHHRGEQLKREQASLAAREAQALALRDYLQTVGHFAQWELQIGAEQ